MKNIVIIALLLSVNQINAQKYSKETKQSIERGTEIYTDFCINCHLASGEGVFGVYPPLAKSDFLKLNRIKSINAVKFGMSGEITVNGEQYNSVMAAPGLDDEEIADVMNYIFSNWGNKMEKPVTKEEVSKISK